jgi:N-acetylmuramoyl-L-alanine amidase
MLAQARELKRRLEATGRFRVVLTRSRDVFVRLRKRIAIARDAGADLFISLHADTIANPKVRGGSIYTLSERASDKEAAALAARENKADVIAGVHLSGQNREVVSILIDLAQRSSMNESAIFAKILTAKLSVTMRLLRRTHRFAGFAVLKAPDIPSVLVELGYLSNPVDERNLRRFKHRARIAQAFVRAIDGYFSRQQAFNRP